MLRPGDGISPMELNNVLGKVVNKNITPHTKIYFKDFD
jgi:sialic acid synthase SpsE